MKHYLQNNFGTPYDADYYAGDFLMGPNLFCWQPICNVGASDIGHGLRNFHLKDLDDVRLFLNKMKLVEGTFSTYIKNMRLGIKAGMVRSNEECLAGINSFKQKYLQVSIQGEQGMSRAGHPMCSRLIIVDVRGIKEVLKFARVTRRVNKALIIIYLNCISL